MAKRGRNNTGEVNDGASRIGGIVEFGRGPLRPAATSSPRRGISGISGGRPEASAAKRTRFVQINTPRTLARTAFCENCKGAHAAGSMLFVVHEAFAHA